MYSLYGLATFREGTPSSSKSKSASSSPRFRPVRLPTLKVSSSLTSSYIKPDPPTTPRQNTSRKSKRSSTAPKSLNVPVSSTSEISQPMRTSSVGSADVRSDVTHGVAHPEINYLALAEQHNRELSKVSKFEPLSESEQRQLIKSYLKSKANCSALFKQKATSKPSPESAVRNKQLESENDNLPVNNNALLPSQHVQAPTLENEETSNHDNDSPSDAKSTGAAGNSKVVQVTNPVLLKDETFERKALKSYLQSKNSISKQEESNFQNFSYLAPKWRRIV